MTFIDRQAELKFLEEKWQDPKSQLIVLWGKRRVGKTELVKQFIDGKPSLYFLSESTSDKEQLQRFSQLLGEFLEEPLLLTRGFSVWEEAFAYLKNRKERFVLVFDEFPYLIQSNPAIPSIFQKGWDEYLASSNIYLILLGSSVTMMENEVLGYRSPLYGRRTGQWLVDPMPFRAASQFRADKPFWDRLAHFAIAGGIPAYWLQFFLKKDFAGNLRDHVFRKGEMLYDEVEFLLRAEVREPRYYFALLQAIAQGKRKLSEIVNASGLQQSLANKYLGVLSDLRIVEREVPVTEAVPMKSKKGLYRISDEFCRFWFRFVLPHRSELEMGRLDHITEECLKQLPQFLGETYEKVAKETLLADMGSFFPFSAIGRWWDRGDEIDVVAINPDRDSILFCEVKTTEKKVGTDILNSLRDKARKVKWGSFERREFFCLFSRTGFTSALQDQAQHEEVVLYCEDQRVLP
ncbi:MAG: ATP-binding protein [Desulfocapsaceae bacterium]|nr:ATP-binding protein [Desulfocapsaceae bacterium]